MALYLLIVNLFETLECEFVPKGRITIPKCKALPLGQIHVPRFLQNRTLCVGGAWRRWRGGDLSSSLLASASYIYYILRSCLCKRGHDDTKAKAAANVVYFAAAALLL